MRRWIEMGTSRTRGSAGRTWGRADDCFYNDSARSKQGKSVYQVGEIYQPKHEEKREAKVGSVRISHAVSEIVVVGLCTLDIAHSGELIGDRLHVNHLDGI